MTFRLIKAAIAAPSLLVMFLLGSCGNQHSDPGEKQKTDSLEIKLNSPELKEVNAQILYSPGDAALYNKRARVYMRLNQLQEGVNDAKRAIRLDSTKPEYYLTLVDAHFMRNETRPAKDVLETVEKKFPGNTEALLKLAEIYYLVQNYQKGIDYVNKALKIDEHIAKAYYIKGSIYRESGDTAKAVSSLETAVEQDNRYEDAFYDLGILFAARKNPIAFQYYDNVLRINPSSSNAAYARAKLLQDLGRTEEAIAAYEHIIASNPRCENCFYNLGAIWLEVKKDPKKALEYFTKAIEINPSYVEAYFARGYTYTKLKDKESAKADYNMCLRIEPNYNPAVEGLNGL
jgi:tetratricopeptide (TPR) repeat protein